MENNQFIHKKSPIIEQYRRKRRQIASAVAGHGFSYEPGFMYDYQNDLEIDTKLQLADLNYQIFEGAVNRELKQSKSDYDIAYKTAAIEWDIAKSELFADWEQELAAIRQGREFDEEALKVIAIEVSRRGITLIEAKEVIALEVEAIQKQMAELDGTTGEYEIWLAEAKVRTAQKKLEIIPIVQELIGIEQQLVGKEQQLVEKAEDGLGKEQILLNKSQDILAIEQQIASRHGEIIAKQYELVEKQNEMLAKERTVLAHKELLADARREVAMLNYEMVDGQSSIAEIESQVVAAEAQYLASKNSIIALKNEIADINAANLITKQETVESDGALVYDKMDIMSRKIAYTNQRMWYELPKYRELFAKDVQLLQETQQLALIFPIITNLEYEIAGKDIVIAGKQVEIADGLIDIVNKNAEYLEKRNEILDVLSRLLYAERETVNKYYTVYVEQGELIAQQQLAIEKTDDILIAEKNIISKENSIIEAKSDLLDGEQALISTEKNALSQMNGAERLQASVIAQQVAVVNQEAQINISFEQLITKEEEIQAVFEEIADISKDVAAKVDEVVDEETKVVDLLETLNTTKEQTIDDYQFILDKENEKQTELETLLTEQGILIDDKIANLQPAIETLTTAIDNYIDEIETQSDLYDDIVDQRDEIIAILGGSSLVAANPENRSDEMDNLVTEKTSLKDEMELLFNDMEALQTYRDTNLKHKLVELNGRLQAYIGEIPTQISHKEQAIEWRRQASELVGQEVQKELSRLSAEKDYEETKGDLAQQQRLIDEAMINNRQDNAQEVFGDINELMTTLSTDFTQYQEDRSQFIADRYDKKDLLTTNTWSRKKAVTDLLEGAKQSNYINKSEHTAQKIIDIAGIKADASGITAKLKHILSQE